MPHRLLSSVCKAYPITMAKTVRYRLDFAEELLEKDPGLRIVALFRDPRGYMNSRFLTLAQHCSGSVIFNTFRIQGKDEKL